MSDHYTSAGANIDPNSWTTEELLKHTYRLVIEMNNKMDEQKKEFASDRSDHNKKIEGLERKVTILETRIDEKQKAFKNIMAIIATGLTLLSLGLSFAVYFLK